jgi:hypothetical protein
VDAVVVAVGIAVGIAVDNFLGGGRWCVVEKD